MSKPSTDNISFTTTAMPRPELISKTYESFKNHIKWLDLKKIKLYLNIDPFPIGDSKEQTNQVIEIAQSYFKEVVVRNEYIASFPSAVKWIFSQVETEYVFNLEDDWELLCDIPDYIPDFFESNPKLIQIGFRAWKKSDPRFVLSPSILKSSFCKYVSSKMHTGKNPEEQIRGLNPYNVDDCFMYWPYESDKILLRDLGRSWMKTTSFGRGLDTFTKWSFLSNPITRERLQIIQDQNSEIDISKLDGRFGDKNVSN